MIHATSFNGQRRAAKKWDPVGMNRGQKTFVFLEKKSKGSFHYKEKKKKISLRALPASISNFFG
jgi:hypothetical protein